MLFRHTAPNSVITYRSPLLTAIGVPHGFSTRIGGVSTGPFDSMNLGNPNGCEVQDEATNIDENYRRLLAAIDAEDRRLLRVHQVHGDRVITASADFDHHAQADAIVTEDAATVASIRIADCVPILLSRRDGRKGAAVHAGWRGVIAGVVARAVRVIGDDQPVVAAIGPCIGFQAFEVGQPVLDAFAASFDHPPLRLAGDGKGFVDLREAVRRQLVDVGVNDIDTTDRCTHRHRDEFFSHRREHGITGRLAALIGPKAD